MEKDAWCYHSAKLSDKEWEILRVASGFPPRGVKNTEMEAAMTQKYFPLPGLCLNPEKEPLFGAGTELPPSQNNSHSFNVVLMKNFIYYFKLDF